MMKLYNLKYFFSCMMMISIIKDNFNQYSVFIKINLKKNYI